MTCSACAIVRQYVMNLLIWTDTGINVALAGDPNEMVSQRLGRAQAAGNRVARSVCRVLSLIHRNHCAWANDGGPSMGREVWR